MSSFSGHIILRIFSIKKRFYCHFSSNRTIEITGNFIHFFRTIVNLLHHSLIMEEKIVKIAFFDLVHRERTGQDLHALVLYCLNQMMFPALVFSLSHDSLVCSISPC